jgi:hypothetical protein
MSRGLDQRDRGVECTTSVLGSGEEGKEQPDHLVTDELLDDCVVVDENVPRDP